MIDILELEKRHKKYIANKNRPKVIIAILLTIALLLLSLIYLFLKSENKISHQKQGEIALVSTKEVTKVKVIPLAKLPQKVVMKPSHISQHISEIINSDTNQSAVSLPKEEVEKSHYSQSLTASMNFLNNIDTTQIRPEKRHQKDKKQIIKRIEKIEGKSVSPQKNSFEFKKRDDPKDLQDVIRRFKKNKNPHLGLYIAKRYYNMHKYYYAYNYALATNELDNRLEESWLIFAKSLMKLHQKEKAVATLKKYIHHSHSQKAKILFDSIQNGTFK